MRCTACSVITVLGADVPDGSAPTVWMDGLARQLPLGHGKLFSPVCSPVPDWAAWP